MKVKVHLDKTLFTRKPTGGEIGGIRIRLHADHSRSSLTEIEVENLIDFIRTGCTIQPCATYSEDDLENPKTDKNGNPQYDTEGKPLYKQKYSLISQQIFFLDIDNETEDTFNSDRIGEVLSENGLCAAIVYHTFSSKPEHEKFRVCILLDEPITDESERDRIIHALFKIFGFAIDSKCTDKPRLFFGSPNSVIWDECGICSKESVLKLYDKLFPQSEQPEIMQELPLNSSAVTHQPSTYSGGLDKNISPDFDPDVFLDMINPNQLDYDEWFSVSASYKFYEAGGQSFEHWMSWNALYEKDDRRADLNSWNGATGKNITKGTLLHFAQQHSPSEYQSYVGGMNAKSRELKERKARKQFNGNQIAGNNQLMQWAEVKESNTSKRLSEKKFPVDVFPKWVENFIDSACGHIQVDRAMIGSAVLAVGSTACQGRFRISHPSGNGHNEELPLFIAISAEPGERKSSSLKVAYAPIKEFEKNSEVQYNQELAQFTSQKKFLNLQENQAEKTLAKPVLGDSEREAAEKLIESLEFSKLSLKPPKNPNILMGDTTTEAIICRMQETGGNIGLFTAESDFINVLSGMYSSGNASNIGIVLQSYDRERYICDRVMKGTTKIETPTMTICAFVQPSLYSTLLSNDAFRGRGFSARFLLCRPEKRAGTIDHGNTTMIDEPARKQYTDMILTLMKNSFIDNPPSIQWERKAAQFSIEYMNSLEKTMQRGGTMETSSDYAAKAAGRYIRICGILHLMEHYNAPDAPVSIKTAEKAKALHDYYFRQSEIETDVADNMEDRITELIEQAIISLTNKGKISITVSDIWQKIRKSRIGGKNCFNNKDDFNSYLDSIEEIGKIQILTTGKKKNVFVNPFWMKNLKN